MAGASNGRSLVLVLTELTGMYCISSVLLIRKQLPLQYRCAQELQNTTDALPNLPNGTCVAL